jgi:hypothetical protein
MQFTNSPTAHTMERPPRAVCGDVMITKDGRLGVCILHPHHRHPAAGSTSCLPSPYLGR